MQIHQLTTLLHEAKFKAPSGDCLSPAGEYNLRLGIMKVRWGRIKGGRGDFHFWGSRAPSLSPPLPTHTRTHTHARAHTPTHTRAHTLLPRAPHSPRALVVRSCRGSQAWALLLCSAALCVQEVSPDLVATASEKPAVVDGHPFIVEAGVSLGGKRAKEGITVYRFANRIPLLFEGGGDVVTRTAMKRIK